MAANDQEVIGEEKYNAILNKTKKLSEKLQGKKRAAFPAPKKDQVKRIKLSTDALKKETKQFGNKGTKKPSTTVKVEDENASSGKNKKKANQDKFAEDKKPILQVNFEDGEKVDWKKYKAYKKELKAHRRGKKVQPVLRDSLDDARSLWIELTMRTASKANQIEMSKKMYKLLSPNIYQASLKHDTARYVQAMISKGDSDIRNKIFETLKEKIIDLARGKYSHHVIVHLIKNGSKEQNHHIIKSFDGNVLKLMNDSVGCRVLEEAFNDHATSLERARIIQEFFDPEYVRVKDDEVKCLKDALAKNPTRKTEILTRVGTVVRKCIEKNRWRLPMFHVLLLEYLTHAEADDKADILESSNQHLIEIVHTKEGARVAMNALWEGDKKARKAIVKSFKGKVAEICKEEHGFRVLLALFDCVDDTVLVSKAIVGEIVANIGDVMSTASGQKVVLYILAPRHPKYFDADTVQLLSVGDGNPHTKKELEAIHSELRSTILPGLVEYLAENISSYLQNNKMALFLETLFNHITDKGPVYKAMAEYIAAQDADSFAKSRYIMKAIAKLMKMDDETTKPKLATALLENLTAEKLDHLVEGFEGFIFALVSTSDSKAKNFTILKKLAKKLVKKLDEDTVRKCISASCADKDTVEEWYKKLQQIVG